MISVLFKDVELVRSRVPFENVERHCPCRVLLFAPHSDAALHQKLIDDIMKACNVPANQYLLADEQALWKDYRQGRAEEVIVFGDLEEQIGLSIALPKNRPIRFDGRVWIKTDGLERLSSHKNLKNSFWNEALKPYFLS